MTQNDVFILNPVFLVPKMYIFMALKVGNSNQPRLELCIVDTLQPIHVQCSTHLLLLLLTCSSFRSTLTVIQLSVLKAMASKATDTKLKMVAKARVIALQNPMMLLFPYWSLRKLSTRWVSRERERFQRTDSRSVAYNANVQISTWTKENFR